MKTEFPEEGKPDSESATLRMLIMMNVDVFLVSLLKKTIRVVFILFTDFVLLIYDDASDFNSYH